MLRLKLINDRKKGLQPSPRCVSSWVSLIRHVECYVMKMLDTLHNIHDSFYKFSYIVFICVSPINFPSSYVSLIINRCSHRIYITPVIFIYIQCFQLSIWIPLGKWKQCRISLSREAYFIRSREVPGTAIQWEYIWQHPQLELWRPRIALLQFLLLANYDECLTFSVWPSH